MIMLVWSKENETHERKLKAKLDIDFEFIDQLIWRYVNEGYVVSLAFIGNEK